MKDERMQILKMVQEGKLSPDEAASLLEALEPPGTDKKAVPGPKPTHVRVVISEGGRPKSFSVGVGLATWVLSLPGVKIDLGNKDARLDTDALLNAIEKGRVGKVFEAEEGKKRVEIWLDA